MAVALHDTTAVSSGPDGDALAVLPIDQFTERLEALRKVYRAVSQRETPWGALCDAVEPAMTPNFRHIGIERLF